jgi:hypothetical protein
MTVAQTENSELAELSLDELADEIATLASHVYAGTCRWLELVAEFDRRGGFEGSSVAEWLAWRCALSPRAARDHVRVARRLAELPLIHEAFANGELSYAKVRALCRVADEESEEELLELARHMTASQLERAVRACQRVSKEQANTVEENAYVGWCWDEDGSFVLRARLAPADGALFLRALAAGRDALNHRAWDDERGSAEPRPTNAEALVAMADMSLSGNPERRSGGERYSVVVHVDAANGACALEDGPALAEATTERLACDASMVEIRERDGQPLSVGRKTRVIPPAMRRALQARDRRCRYPGCENRRFLDAHHVRHWAKGGETKLTNLVLLCRRHHRFLHEGGFSVEALSGGRLRFWDRWGAPIENVPRPPPGSPDALRDRNRIIDAERCASGDGDETELEYVVDALLHIAGRR